MKTCWGNGGIAPRIINLGITSCQAAGELATLESKQLIKVVPVLPLTEHHAMKAHWGNGGTAPPVLHLGS
jgi:hypothetical protein